MLGDCLSSISRTVDAAATPFEVIVLFQQMSRNSAAAFLSGVQGVRDLHARLNLGFGGGCNFASRYARGDYLLFLNDDTIVQEGWLQALLTTAKSDPRIGAVGSRLIFPHGMLQEAGVIVWSDGSAFPLGRGEPPGSLAYTYLRDVHYASANGLLVKRASFDSIGRFDERFFPGYYEDVDLCMSLRHLLGERVVYEPRSVIVHRESATSSRDPDLRSFLFQRHQTQFHKKWANELASYPAPEPESRCAIERAVLRASGCNKHILVIDDRVPQIGMGSGAGRIADMLTDLSGAGHAVAFAPTDRGRMPAVNSLAGLGIDLVAEPLLEHLAQTGRRYDMVIISRPHNFHAFHAAVRRAMPSALVVYDVEALYHRRLFLQSRLEGDDGTRGQLEREANEMERLETEIARSADRLVAISDSEAEWLDSIEGHPPIHFMRPLARGVPMTPPTLEGRMGAIFIAGWLAGEQSPNVGALRWYVQEVLPHVRAVIPDFATYVSGANPPLSVQSMTSDALILTGFIESIEGIYRSARIAIAPILAGAGVKIKTIEALQYGVPVVATSVGAEGLALSDGDEIDVCDDGEEFAKRLIALASDDRLWLQRRESIARRITEWQRSQIGWGEVIDNVLNEREADKQVITC